MLLFCKPLKLYGTGYRHDYGKLDTLCSSLYSQVFHCDHLMGWAEIHMVALHFCYSNFSMLHVLPVLPVFSLEDAGLYVTYITYLLFGRHWFMRVALSVHLSYCFNKTCIELCG